MNDPTISFNPINDFKINPTAVDYWLNLIGVSALAGSCAAIISDDMRTFKGIFRCSLLAVLAGYITGSLCEGYNINDGMTHALVGLAGFLANYLFIFILQVMKMALANPMAIINYFIGFLPGKKEKP